ncbi:hypothetical protein LOZ36_005775, partial [Ophidiomyces ophidiicola]
MFLGVVPWAIDYADRGKILLVPEVEEIELAHPHRRRRQRSTWWQRGNKRNGRAISQGEALEQLLLSGKFPFQKYKATSCPAALYGKVQHDLGLGKNDDRRGTSGGGK